MQKRLFIISLTFALISCGGFGSAKKRSVAQEPVQPKIYNYEVINTYPHSTDSYTQGLIYHEGRLFEGTGLTGESRLLDVDIESGESKTVATLPNSFFGEGVTILGDTIYQLTWRNNRLLFYDLNSGEKIGEKLYSGEGWGLTTDGEKLYMSDGSSILKVRHPHSFDIERKILVTVNGEPLENLNELEWIDGKIWANVYMIQQIVIIDPESGVVEGIVDMRGVLADEDRTTQTDVFNGIAYDKQGKRIFVTGKNWSKLFEIKIIEQ